MNVTTFDKGSELNVVIKYNKNTKDITNLVGYMSQKEIEGKNDRKTNTEETAISVMDGLRTHKEIGSLLTNNL